MIEKYITEDQLEVKITELALKINNDYKNEELVIICILNGSFMFCADLIRKLDLDLIMEFMSASSYGESTDSSGTLDIRLDIERDIKGKNVLIVEDIVDTGLTLNKIKELLLARDPKSLKIASLLHKPARKIHHVDIEYLGFEIEDKFVIGYGLDYANKYRELPYIGIYQNS
ncbi:MAG: hypoxanthine phosphoribosyltransferase [Halobacteriovoraceae bacterium]|nr:hypoxanthine phosphoribosyltransferase [Halobacteriovoraceae bacterium]